MTGTVGRPLDRVEGRDKVTGAARYTADNHLPDMVHAVLVQSEIAHGAAGGRQARGHARVMTVSSLMASVLNWLRPVTPTVCRCRTDCRSSHYCATRR